MKIRSITLFQKDLPYAGGEYRLSGGRTYSQFDASIVRIESDQGFVGWGESTPFGRNYIPAFAEGVRAGIAVLAPVLIGQDPLQPDCINRLMDETLAGNWAAKAALDVACWDLFGQSVNRPVCHLLGGSTEQALQKISSIHVGDPDDMRARVAKHRNLGYQGHSVKIGASESEGGPALDAARIIASLSDRCQGEYFLLDANGGMTVEYALRLMNLLSAELDVVWEAPCATWAEHLRLRSQCSQALVMDELIETEADAILAVQQNTCDGFGLKITKQGGLTRSRRIRDIACAAGMTMSVQDTVGSAIAFAAVAHMAQTVPAKLLRCVLDTRDMATEPLASLDLNESEAGFTVGEKPGLGLEVDVGALGGPVEEWT